MRGSSKKWWRKFGQRWYKKEIKEKDEWITRVDRGEKI